MSPFKIILFILFTIAFVFCNKPETEHPTSEPQIPVGSISFASPTEGAIYNIGDTIRIQAKATSTDEIHGYDITIRQKSDSSIIYFKQPILEHNDTLLINQKWKDTVSITTDMEVVITIVLDHNNNKLAKKVGIKVL